MSPSSLIKKIAADLGFSYCGIAKARALDEDARRLESWLHQGFQGSMHYMENHFELRIDPRKLIPGAQTVITLLINYYPEEKQIAGDCKISKYAYGKDYHEVIRAKLHAFHQALTEKFGAIEGRGFVDSAPVLERSWAMESGLGWIGKNGNLITKKEGSFFFIATLITDLKVDTYDNPYTKDYCGTCTKCIDTCPTEAILPNKVIKGNQCISYFTIELKDELIQESLKGRFDNWMFGCDICQDVCPWNRFSKPHQTAELKPISEILEFSAKDWNELTEEKFKIIFKDSPIKRTKFKGIRRNLNFLQNEAREQSE